MKNKKWLEFEEMCVPKRWKTKRFKVNNKITKEQIGWIEWDTGWRKYVFTNWGDIKIGSSCHRELADFIDKLMKKKKEAEV